MEGSLGLALTMLHSGCTHLNGTQQVFGGVIEAWDQFAEALCVCCPQHNDFVQPRGGPEVTDVPSDLLQLGSGGRYYRSPVEPWATNLPKCKERPGPSGWGHGDKRRTTWGEWETGGRERGKWKWEQVLHLLRARARDEVVRTPALVSCDELWDVDGGPWAQSLHVRPQLFLQPPIEHLRAPHGLSQIQRRYVPAWGDPQVQPGPTAGPL